MCTAISLDKGAHLFGRNLDLEYSYGEGVTVTPKGYMLKFRQEKEIINRYAMVGMAIIGEKFPLYFEATNEKGLSVAALSFTDAVYREIKEGYRNVASFEVIPWLLCQCETVEQCRNLLSDINVTNAAFSEEYPPSPLHWLISDKASSIVLECDGAGLHVYENRADILTNRPLFPFQLYNLSSYMHLSENQPQNFLSDTVPLTPYSKGAGATGLPGDMTSASRFVRGFFVKEKLSAEKEYEKRVMQFFHLLDSVSMPRGTVKTDEGEEYTVYSCCCDTEKGIYYFRSYYDSRIKSVSLHRVNSDADRLFFYPAGSIPSITELN